MKKSLILLASLLLSCHLATATAEEEKPKSDEIGRYVVVPDARIHFGGASREQMFTIKIDTKTGETWILMQVGGKNQDGGFSVGWVKINHY